MKRFLSFLLAIAVGFSVPATAQEAVKPASSLETKLEKATEEAARNRDLLEIWKDHVRTVTQERDAAFRELEALKSAAKTNPPAVAAPSGNMARFGQVETLPLPAALPPAAVSANSNLAVPAAGQPADFKAYQETIRQLRAELEEARISNQRMQKEAFEAGNDKTLIIRDKEQALEKIDGMSKQIRSLQDENKNLNERLRSAGAPPPASAQSIVASYAPGGTLDETAALKNSYNAQSEKLKQVTREKDLVIQRANELQVKYVDLQSSYEKLRSEKSIPVVSASPKPAAPAKDPKAEFEVNHYKSQNAKLKAELEQLRADQAKNAAALSTSLKSSQESVGRTIDSLKKENADLRALVARQRSDLDAKLASTSPVASTSPAPADAQLKAQIDALVSDNKILKSRLGEQDAELMAVRRDLDAARAEAERLRAESASKSSAQKDEDRKYMEGALSDMTYKMKRREEAFDQALKKIEILKAENKKLAGAKQTYDTALRALRAQQSAPAAQTAPAVPSAADLARQRALESEKAALEAEVARLSSNLGSSQTAREESLTLRAQKESLQNQLAELRADLEAANELARKSREKNASLSASVQSLEAEKEEAASLRAENQRLVSERQALKGQLADLKSETETLNENVRALQNEKQAASSLRAENRRLGSEADRARSESEGLKGQIDRLNADLRSLQEEKDAASSIRTQYQQLQTENQSLKSQIDGLNVTLRAAQSDKDAAASLRTQYQQTLAEKEDLNGQVERLSAALKLADAEKQKSTRAEAEKIKLSYENDSLRSQIEQLKANLQSAKAEKETALVLRQEKTRLASENETMKKAMIDVEREAQANEESASRLRQRNALLERENQEQRAQIEELKASLQKSLDDIQNLKSNFQSYLESLVSSFEERQQKKGQGPSAEEESNAP